jgi:MATE family multidrug resistance protein
MSAPVPRFRQELAATIRLAAPLALAQLAQVAMGATDTVLLGTLGSDTLAAGGLGANLYFTLMIVVAGGLIAVSILVAHARGAGRHDRIGPIVRGGFLLALLSAVPPMLLLWNVHPLLTMIGEPPALADAIARYDRILLFAMPASLLMATQRNFLAAMGRPYMVMAVAVAAVVINGLLNYGLIHGAWGLPRMGYIGSATATLITLWAMMLAIALEMRFTRTLKPFRLFGQIEWHIIVEMAALGWPIAFITALEIVLFSTAAMLIGRFGATQLAAHQISMGIASVTFMVPLAITQAVNVRVGYYTGQDAPRAARRAGIAAFALGVGFMVAMAAMLLSIPDLIAGFYISGDDPARGEVIALAVRLLTVAAFFQVFDGAQTIAATAGMRVSFRPLSAPAAMVCAPSNTWKKAATVKSRTASAMTSPRAGSSPEI